MADFVYIFERKPTVYVPTDYSFLTENDYLCIYREPLMEMIDITPRGVVVRMWHLSRSPDWYKRGLQPLSSPDIIWLSGKGYRLIPDPCMSGTLFRAPGSVTHCFDGVHVEEVEIDPRKILAQCKA